MAKANKQPPKDTSSGIVTTDSRLKSLEGTNDIVLKRTGDESNDSKLYIFQSIENPDVENLPIDISGIGGMINSSDFGIDILKLDVAKLTAQLSDETKNRELSIRHERLSRAAYISSLCDTIIIHKEQIESLLKEKEAEAFKRFCKHPIHSGFSVNMLETMWTNRNTQLSW